MALVRETAGPVCTGRQFCKVLPTLPCAGVLFDGLLCLVCAAKERSLPLTQVQESEGGQR